MNMQSETIGKLAEALCKAQHMMGPVIKGAKNPFFKSTYAKLSDCIDAIREPFAENGLSFSQSHREESESTFLVTTILHISGEWLKSEIKLRPGKPDMQGIMAASTYAKRCALVAIAGLAEEDDDGNHTQRHEEGVIIEERNRPIIASDWRSKLMSKLKDKREQLNITSEEIKKICLARFSRLPPEMTQPEFTDLFIYLEETFDPRNVK